MAFLRRVAHRHSKLGKNRKKKQIWRKPTGRDNKMREQRNGRPAIVKIGYKRKSEERNNFKVIMNLRDIQRLKKGERVVLGSVGKKKKIEFAKKLEEMKIEIVNLNPNKFLKHVKAQGSKTKKRLDSSGQKQKLTEKSKPEEKKK